MGDQGYIREIRSQEGQKMVGGAGEAGGEDHV